MKLQNYLKKNPKKYLIFDFDETIAHLILPWSIYKSKGAKILGKYDEKLCEQLAKDLNTLQSENAFVKKYGDKIKAEISDWSEEFETKHLEEAKRNPEIINFIKKEHGNHQFFIWSSNTSKAIRPVLEKEEILDKFELLVTKEIVRLIKPEIDGFELIQKQISRINKKEAENLDNYLMIGNSILSDGGAAKNSGIDFFPIEYFGKASTTY
ncbi:MAG: HAD hydrolase-like protein [Patescibacteria group bacterium]